MAKELNEDTTLNLSIKTLAGIAVLIFTLVGMWFTLQSDITEAKELPQQEIHFIADLTDKNQHNSARLQLAQLMRNRRLEKGYRAIETLANMFNQMNELMKAREKLDKMLFTQAKRMYSNYDDIYGAF